MESLNGDQAAGGPAGYGFDRYAKMAFREGMNSGYSKVSKYYSIMSI